MNRTASGAVPYTTADEMTGLGVDQTFWRNDVTNVAKRVLLTDLLRSTVATTTQANGTTVKDTYTYTPYGLQTNSLSETNPFQYTGREWDGATGLQYNRARYYNPVLGQFISADTSVISRSIFSPNVFAYGSDEPSYRTDASGMGQQDCSFLCLDLNNWPFGPPNGNQYPCFNAEISYGVALGGTALIIFGAPEDLFLIALSGSTIVRAVQQGSQQLQQCLSLNP